VDVDLLDMTFSLENEDGDIIELVPGGNEILVSKENL
jgi:hypothetical protein